MDLVVCVSTDQVHVRLEAVVKLHFQAARSTVERVILTVLCSIYGVDRRVLVIVMGCWMSTSCLLGGAGAGAFVTSNHPAGAF